MRSFFVIREVYNDKQKNTLKSAIQYLENAFPEKNKNIRKISIPMLIYLADIAEYDEVKPRFFRDWWSYFTEEDALFEVYKTFCSSGSTKLEKIKGRLAIMTKSFCKYFELDYPEELVDMIAEVEEKMAAKEEKAEDEVLEDGNYKFAGVKSYMTCGFKNTFGDDAELIASVALDLILTTYPDNADYLQSFVYTYPNSREVKFWCINDVDHITFLLPSEY